MPTICIAVATVDTLRFAHPTILSTVIASEAKQSIAPHAEMWIVAIAPRNDGGETYPLLSAATARHTSSLRSTSVTPMSIRMTKADSTNMPANTAATSNTPSACWIK